MTEFDKPRKYRNPNKDKKTHKDEDLHHPIHKPYERDTSWRRNIIIDGRGDYEDDEPKGE